MNLVESRMVLPSLSEQTEQNRARHSGKDVTHTVLCRNMVTQLIEHERIETTLAKAKELRRFADSCVTLAKKVRVWVC